MREQAQSTGLIVFSYLNPILRMGMEKFCTVARHAGVDGVLVTDLPVEEARRLFAGDESARFGAGVSGSADQFGCAAEADCCSVARICVCGVEDWSDRSAAELGGRCAETCAAIAARNPATGWRLGLGFRMRNSLRKWASLRMQSSSAARL